MGKSSYLLLAGILIVGAALSVLAWLAGKGKFSLTAIPKTLNTATFGSFLGILPGIKIVPKQIASLTTPVTKIVDRVDKLDGDVLTVTVYATSDVTLLTSVPAVLIRFADL